MLGKPLDELRDQAAHFTSAAISVTPLLVYPAWWSAAIAGFALGMSREIGEQRPPLTFDKLRAVFASQKFDLTFWTLGGGAAWLAFGA